MLDYLIKQRDAARKMRNLASRLDFKEWCGGSECIDVTKERRSHLDAKLSTFERLVIDEQRRLRIH